MQFCIFFHLHWMNHKSFLGFPPSPANFLSHLPSQATMFTLLSAHIAVFKELNSCGQNPTIKAVKSVDSQRKLLSLLPDCDSRAAHITTTKFLGAFQYR